MWHENIFQSFKNRTEAEYPEYEHGDFCRHYAGCGTGHPWFHIPDKARLSGGGVHVPGAVHERGLYHLHLRRGPDGAASGGSRVPGTENPQTVPGDAHQPGYAAGVEFTIYVLYAAVSMALVFPMAAVFWGVRLPGSPAAFLGGWLLTLVSTLSIGMLVGGIAKNEKMASVIACLLYFPMLIFSGATLPFEVMPKMMQKIVALFPLTQGIQLMKAAFLGIHMESVWAPAAVMGIVTILCAGAAVKFFKWE